MIQKILDIIEAIGRRRAARELYRLGHHKIASDLLNR
jgi:hypothetical protein